MNRRVGSAIWRIPARYSSKQRLKEKFDGRLGSPNEGDAPSPLPSSEKRGLFGVEGLNSPDDFARLSKHAQSRVEDLHQEIISLGETAMGNMTSQTAKQILTNLDLMSESICAVADTSEVCRQIHSEKKWLRAADKEHQNLHKLISNLNTDRRLLHASEPILRPEIHSTLNKEQKQVSKSFVEEFRSHGLHKDEDTRQAIINTEEKINRCISETEFLMYKSNQNASSKSILQKYEETVAARQELATLLSKESYGDLILSRHSQFNTPSEAIAFIQQFGENLHGNHPTRNPGHVNIDEYFTLGSCMEGLSMLIENLFHLRLVVTRFNEGEGWASNIYRVEIREEDDSVAGIVYLDLYPRENKFTGEATFSVNFCTQTNGWKVPHAVAVLNSSLSTPGNPLNYSFVTALFHEFGHILHTLLSRTQYQHLAGVRATTDFVEMPSTLMEKFLQNYDFVSQFARHWVNNTPIPRELFDKHVEYIKLKKLLDSQRTTVLSLFDLYVHSNLKPGVNWKHIENTIIKESNFPNIHSLDLPNFSHLIYYASAYYCYPLCQVYSNTIYAKQFESNPFSFETGHRYRTQILSKGGGEDPTTLMKTFLKGESPLNFDNVLS